MLFEKEYICVSFGKVNSENNRSLFRALYYCQDIGRRRIYRNYFPEPDDKCFKLLKYKSLKYAQKVCDEINKQFNEDFEPIEIVKIDYLMV